MSSTDKGHTEFRRTLESVLPAYFFANIMCKKGKIMYSAPLSRLSLTGIGQMWMRKTLEQKTSWYYSSWKHQHSAVLLKFWPILKYPFLISVYITPYLIEALLMLIRLIHTDINQINLYSCQIKTSLFTSTPICYETTKS
jgi:hypothetical protein